MFLAAWTERRLRAISRLPTRPQMAGVHVHTRVLTAMKTFPTSPLGLVARGRTAEEPRRNGLSSAEDLMRFVLAGPHHSAESSVPPAFKNIILIYWRVVPLLRPPRAGGA